MPSYLMQAKSSVSGSLVAWVRPDPDFAGAYFPGPGTPSEIAATILDTNAPEHEKIVAPQLISVSPTSGTLAGGEQIELTGLDFKQLLNPIKKVKFQETEVPFTVVDNDTILVTAPPYADIDFGPAPQVSLPPILVARSGDYDGTKWTTVSGPDLDSTAGTKPAVTAEGEADFAGDSLFSTQQVGTYLDNYAAGAKVAWSGVAIITVDDAPGFMVAYDRPQVFAAGQPDPGFGLSVWKPNATTANVVFWIYDNSGNTMENGVNVPLGTKVAVHFKYVFDDTVSDPGNKRRMVCGLNGTWNTPEFTNGQRYLDAALTSLLRFGIDRNGTDTFDGKIHAIGFYEGELSAQEVLAFMGAEMGTEDPIVDVTVIAQDGQDTLPNAYSYSVGAISGTAVISITPHATLTSKNTMQGGTTLSITPTNATLEGIPATIPALFSLSGDDPLVVFYGDQVTTGPGADEVDWVDEKSGADLVNEQTPNDIVIATVNGHDYPYSNDHLGSIFKEHPYPSPTSVLKQFENAQSATFFGCFKHDDPTENYEGGVIAMAGTAGIDFDWAETSPGSGVFKKRLNVHWRNTGMVTSTVFEVVDGQWHRVIAVIDNLVLRVYVDGVHLPDMDFTFTQALYPDMEGVDIYTMRSVYSFQSLLGGVTCAGILKRAVTPTERAALDAMMADWLGV